MLTLSVIATLTVSYAQTGDSLTCYNNQELKRIATSVVYAAECDSLLSVSETQLAYKDSVINNLEMSLDLKDSALYECGEKSDIQDELIENLENEIDQRNKTIVKQKRKLKWTKVGWVATTAGLIGLWLSALL